MEDEIKALKAHVRALEQLVYELCDMLNHERNLDSHYKNLYHRTVEKENTL